jgi:hypothetical protein
MDTSGWIWVGAKRIPGYLNLKINGEANWSRYISSFISMVFLLHPQWEISAVGNFSTEYFSMFGRIYHHTSLNCWEAKSVSECRLADPDERKF